MEYQILFSLMKIFLNLYINILIYQEYLLLLIINFIIYFKLLHYIFLQLNHSIFIFILTIISVTYHYNL